MSSQPTDADLARVETELRLAGERLLLRQVGRHRGHVSGSGLAEIASALIELCGLPSERAQEIVDDYTLALSLRGRGSPPVFRQARQQARFAAPRALTLPTVFHVDHEVVIAGDSAHVGSIVLTEEQCEVSVTYDAPPKRHRPGRQGYVGPGQHGFPPQLTVCDDQGTSSQAHFSGGGGDDGWEGHWTTQSPLSVATTWLELNGTRVWFPPPVVASAVQVEELSAMPATHRYLWHRLGLWQHGAEEDSVLDLLWRLGLLDPDDEADAELLTALDLVGQALLHSQQLTAPAAGVPEPWSSYLGPTRRRKARTGSVPVAAVTPLFDGVQCSVYGLQSDENGFRIQVRVIGDSGPRHPFQEAEVGGTSPVWWAHDDRGNVHLGHWNSNSSGFREISGSIAFWPVLDPTATVLTLCPTGLRHRALIAVHLPAWDRR